MDLKIPRHAEILDVAAGSGILSAGLGVSRCCLVVCFKYWYSRFRELLRVSESLQSCIVSVFYVIYVLRVFYVL